MSKVTAKYQKTLSEKVRKELGIVPGAEVDIVKRGTKYILVVDPINHFNLLALFGQPPTRYKVG